MSYNIIDPFKVIEFNSETFCKISVEKIVHTNQDKVQGHEEAWSLTEGCNYQHFHLFSYFPSFYSLGLKIE